MTPWMIAILLKPIGLIVLFSIAYFGKCLAMKYMADGKLKRILFFSWRI